MQAVPAESNEQVWAYVRSDHPLTGAADLTSYPVHIAVTETDPVSADWKPAVWETGTKLIGGVAHYLARLEIGPGGGAVVLTEKTTYQVHVRVTTPTEAPVVYAGAIRAT